MHLNNIDLLLRTLIVEDEPLSRLNLVNIVDQFFPRLEVIGWEATEAGALEAIRAMQPALIFLDIELQSGTGFGVIEKMKVGSANIIFTTAMDDRAINLLRINGVPYLQKPIDIEQLAIKLKSIERVRKNEASGLALRHLQATLVNDGIPDTIFFETPENTGHFPIKDIVRFEASGEHAAMVFMQQSEPLKVAMTIGELDELLQLFGFFRTHKDHLINLSWLSGNKAITTTILKLIDGSEVPLSAKRMAALNERFM